MSAFKIRGQRDVTARQRIGPNSVLCTLVCGHEIVRPNVDADRPTAICKTCRAAPRVLRYEYHKSRGDRHQAQGLCRRCTRRAAPGKVCCAVCLEQHRAAEARYRAKRRSTQDQNTKGKDQ